MVKSATLFDENVLANVFINQYNVEADVKTILSNHQVLEKENIAKWIVKAVTLIDLTTLAGDDTRVNVSRLCAKALNPISEDIFKNLGYINYEAITTAAVCVYPSRVADACDALKIIDAEGKIQVAAVATGFPSGQYPLQTRLSEIKYAVEQGASEIDVVLDRSLVLAGKWSALHGEVAEMKKACGTAHMKVILAVGELGTLENVYKASMVAMMAGADFIKTSTGKESVNATLPVGLVMCRAIRHYREITGRKVGLKPAGGIKTPAEAIQWLTLVHCELGPEWLRPELFRIGASSLLGSLEQALYKMAYPNEASDQGNRFSFI